METKGAGWNHLPFKVEIIHSDNVQHCSVFTAFWKKRKKLLFPPSTGCKTGQWIEQHPTRAEHDSFSWMIHDSSYALGAWLKGDSTGLNHAVKPDNHESTLKETNRLRTQSEGGVQHLCSLPQTWSEGLKFILHAFLLFSFLCYFCTKYAVQV